MRKSFGIWLVWMSIGWTATARGGELPPVTSGELVAQFRADNSSVLRDASNQVQRWRSRNNPDVFVTASGTALANIQYAPNGMNGVPSVAFDDPSGNRYLVGVLPTDVSLTNATVFWLGYYSDDADPNGRYAYSIGSSAGNGATQLTHRRGEKDGVFSMEINNGDTVFTGASIESFDNNYTVWRTEYLANDPASNHRAFAAGVNLGVPGDAAGYDVNPDPHGLYIGSLQAAGFNFDGQIAELLIYDGVLSPEDVAAVELYLTRRLTPGDATNDGVVDGADFTLWADHFGQFEGDAEESNGDFNLDGFVDGADFTLWADHFGASGAAAVPEPASLALLGVAAALAAARMGRRARQE